MGEFFNEGAVEQQRPNQKEIVDFVKSQIIYAINAGWSAHRSTSEPMGGVFEHSFRYNLEYCKRNLEKIVKEGKGEKGKIGTVFYFDNWKDEDYQRALDIFNSLNLNPYQAYQKIMAIDKPGKVDAYIDWLFEHAKKSS